MSKYPKTLHHPAFVRGTTTKVPILDANGEPVMSRGMPDFNYRGTPDRFPPVTVQNDDQEFEYRSKGYLAADEATRAPVYEEYPVWLKNAAGAEVLASNAQQEADFLNSGYERKGKSDPDAVERSKASPYDPDFSADEWPKMIDGKLVQDPSRADHSLHYPMWVGEKLVHNEDEERAARGGAIYRNGKLIAGDPQEKPAQDDRRKALEVLAGLRGVEVTDDMSSDDIERALFPAALSSTHPTSTEKSSGDDEAERQRLLAEAARRGIKVHHKAGILKIRAALEEKAA